MNCFSKLYEQKKQTPEEIANQILSHEICACPTALGEPTAIVRAIANRGKKGELQGVAHHTTFPQYDSLIYSSDLAGRYSGVLWFVGPPSRRAVNEGHADVMPCYFKDIPTLWKDKVKANVFYATVSPMDKHGYFSFGLTAAESMAQFEGADKCFLEINPNMPRTFGNTLIHITQIDGLCENNEPLKALPEVNDISSFDETSLKIGNYVAEEISDDSTLQLGWGNVPNAVGFALKEKNNLGIHSELFTDSMKILIECGAVTNARKNINRFKSVATFALGSRSMYDYLDDNPSVEMHSVDYVNDPYVIAKNDKMISVNAAIEVDFWGQVVAETLNGRPFSSTGGQVDFVRGAQMSKGGISFITMPSTAKDDEVSRIKSCLSLGSVVTTSKNEVDCIVTEYGVARLKGKTWSERTKALISIAHPKFKEELTFEAKKQNIMI